MFKGKSEKSSQFESWRETVLLIFSELCELVSNQRLFTLDSIIERNYLTGKSPRDEFKKEKKKKCCSTNRTNHVDVTWICWTQTQCCRNNRARQLSRSVHGWLLISFCLLCIHISHPLFGRVHCCVACVASCCGPSRVAPEARPESVRKGCCVIGLAFERHIA